jgi:hypothetical protein
VDEALERFLGNWDVEAIFDGEDQVIEGDIGARSSFEWILDGAFLLQRSEVDHPDAPNGHALIAAKSDGDGYTQHYFDSRGVVRLYDMTFDGRTWTLTRESADFSPLDFEQRYVGTFTDDGSAIRGEWQIKHPGEDWKKDFVMNYVRAD